MRRFSTRAFVALAALAMLLIPVVAVAMANPIEAFAGIALATLPVVTDRNIVQIKADLSKLYGELEIGQKAMDEKGLTQAEGTALDQKAEEALALQSAVEQYEKRAGIIQKGREIPRDPDLPASRGDRTAAKGRQFTTPGHLFVLSDAFKQYRQGGKQGWSAPVSMKSLRGRVPLEGERAEKMLSELLERKDFTADMLADLGDDAFLPVARDSELVRFEEPEMLQVRDVISTAPTTSDAVRFVRHTATTRGAASQATRGGVKPYLSIDFAPDTVNVETIAVLSKVTEQDIEDAPRLVSYINGEMRLDVRVEEDRQILWGSGANGELDGIYNQLTTEFARAEVGDTLIDTIRRMRTDIRVRRLSPNAVVLHPIEWEEIELQKGTDERYVWAVVQTAAGPRIWSMSVVETESAENPDTGERRIGVGDWRRAATLYDRHDVRLAVGFVDDDFARNLRTLRAEERVALALKRDFAITYAQTVAPTP